jgi:hypothetical protein
MADNDMMDGKPPGDEYEEIREQVSFETKRNLEQEG